MMSEIKTQKVFVQYMYCPLCRSNHKRGKKHVWTKKHQQIVTNVLKKFSNKIAEAKTSSDEPIVQDMQWPDASRKFWCYFCQSDVDLHKVNLIETGDSVVVQHGGMMEHIVREDHITSTTTFLKNNRVDMKRTPEFVLTKQAYIKFLGNVEKAISGFFQDKADLLQQMSSQIRAQTAIQQQIRAVGLLEQSKQSQEKHRYRQDKEPKIIELIHNEDGQRRKTAQAFGQGLTSVDRSNEDDSLGNIYTKAVPPWMMPDAGEDEDHSQIGPTMKDLEKHRKLERKAKLPATRVGAKFDHGASLSDSWMPSFGGVWHHSRRTDSLKQFNRRQIGKRKLPLTVRSHQTLQEESSSTESFVYPPTLDAARHEETSVNKVPRTTSTTHSPWNTNIFTNPSATTSVSHQSNTVSSFRIQTFSDHSSVSTRQSNATVPVSSNHSPITLNFQSTQPSVKPYVSKRRKQNTSVSPDAMPGSGYPSSYSSTIPQTLYPIPHPSLSMNPHGHSTTDPYTYQYSNTQETSSCGKAWYDPRIENGLKHYRASYPEGSWPPKTQNRTVSTSTQQPVRLISTPLLQLKKDKS